jgi:hypothetical protein
MRLGGCEVTRLGRAVVAGLAGSLAYLVAQEIDRRVANPRSNDLVLIGGMFTANRSAARGLIGLTLHLLGGVSLGLLFETFVGRRLPGPYWLRGILMVQVESATVFPVVVLFDRFHPAIRSGELAAVTRPVYFAQQAWRHLALGAVLGALLSPRSPSPTPVPKHVTPSGIARRVGPRPAP